MGLPSAQMEFKNICSSASMRTRNWQIRSAATTQTLLKVAVSSSLWVVQGACLLSWMQLALQPSTTQSAVFRSSRHQLGALLSHGRLRAENMAGHHFVVLKYSRTT